MPKRKPKYFKFFSKYRALIVAITLVIFGGWFAYSSLLNPLGINELREVSSNPKIAQLYDGEMCAQIYGQCLGYDKECITYTDSCMQAKLCVTPLTACAVPQPTRTPEATCTPRPACLDYKFPCRIADRPGMYCPTPTPKPTSTPVSTPIATPTSKPTPTPTPTPTAMPANFGISNFQAANPCGPSGFYNYSVYCVSGLRKDISTGTCTPLSVALSNAEALCQSK